MVKNLRLFLNVDFDSSKEASWGTERNAKNHRSLPSTITEKIKKNLQKCMFWENFWCFFLIFSVTILGKVLWFFALRSVPQDASFELSKSTLGKNFNFFTIRGVKIS